MPFATEVEVPHKLEKERGVKYLDKVEGSKMGVKEQGFAIERIASAKKRTNKENAKKRGQLSALQEHKEEGKVE